MATAKIVYTPEETFDLFRRVGGWDRGRVSKDRQSVTVSGRVFVEVMNDAHRHLYPAPVECTS